MLTLLILKGRRQFYYFKIVVKYLFRGNLMEFLTSCLWKFCLIYGILAFSDGNSKFENGSPGLTFALVCLHLQITHVHKDLTNIRGSKYSIANGKQLFVASQAWPAV